MLCFLLCRINFIVSRCKDTKIILFGKIISKPSHLQEANAIRMTLAEKDDYVDLLLFAIGILFAFLVLAFVVEFGGGGEEGITT